jgi:hypothetical protein
MITAGDILPLITNPIFVGLVIYKAYLSVNVKLVCNRISSEAAPIISWKSSRFANPLQAIIIKCQLVFINCKVNYLAFAWL